MTCTRDGHAGLRRRINETEGEVKWWLRGAEVKVSRESADSEFFLCQFSPPPIFTVVYRASDLGWRRKAES